MAKEKIKKKDFIEIDFTARVKGGEIFDTTSEEVAKKHGLDIKDIKPYQICTGFKMLLPGLEEDLENKETETDYTVEISPEKSFGLRDTKLIRMVPVKAFHEQKIQPQRGMSFNIDNQLVKVISVSGGRVLVDFNNPLAGKIVVYDYKINKKISERSEKINALQDFFFRKKFPFQVNDNTITFETPKGFDKFVELFSKQFEDMVGLKVSAKVVEDKKEVATEKQNK